MTTASDAPVSTPLLIAGEERPGGDGTFPVGGSGPPGHGGGLRRGGLDGRCRGRRSGRHSEAWPAWAALSTAERVALDAQVAGRSRRRMPTSGPSSSSSENGKTRIEATIDLHRLRRPVPPGGGRRGLELDEAEHARRAAVHDDGSRKLPVGVVTIIYPFNWPLAILAASLPYALMAGNTVIVKPPPATPLSIRPDAAASGAGSAAWRAERRHRRLTRSLGPDRGRRPADQARLLHRQRRRRPADHRRWPPPT